MNFNENVKTIFPKDAVESYQCPEETPRFRQPEKSRHQIVNYPEVSYLKSLTLPKHHLLIYQKDGIIM